MKIEDVNRVFGIVLVLLTLSVGIPLTIQFIISFFGTSGFGIIGPPILFPLNASVLFAVITFLEADGERLRTLFVRSHLITIAAALIGYVVYPKIPIVLIIIPFVLAALGTLDKKDLKYHILVMMLLAIISNMILLKWEFDFDRTLPLIQLFK